MKRILLSFCALALMSSVAAAEEGYKTKQAGDFVIRGRLIAVKPWEGNDTVETRAGADTGLRVNWIDNSVVPEVDFSYFFTDNIALELIAATTRHKITASGVEVGSAQLLPPTLTLQYHFLPQERFSPYIGAGLNYTFFFAESSGSNALVDHLKVDDSLGYALQVGADYALGGRWFINADVKKLWLRPDVTTSALKVNNLDIDPWIVGIGFGYRF